MRMPAPRVHGSIRASVVSHKFVHRFPDSIARSHPDASGWERTQRDAPRRHGVSCSRDCAIDAERPIPMHRDHAERGNEKRQCWSPSLRLLRFSQNSIKRLVLL